MASSREYVHTPEFDIALAVYFGQIVLGAELAEFEAVEEEGDWLSAVN